MRIKNFFHVAYTYIYKSFSFIPSQDANFLPICFVPIIFPPIFITPFQTSHLLINPAAARLTYAAVNLYHIMYIQLFVDEEEKNVDQIDNQTNGGPSPHPREGGNNISKFELSIFRCSIYLEISLAILSTYRNGCFKCLL